MTSHRKNCINNNGFAPHDQASASIVPDRTGDFIDETICVWQKRTARQLTREDGREIIENLTGFFRVLQEWDRSDRAANRERKRSGAQAD